MALLAAVRFEFAVVEFNHRPTAPYPPEFVLLMSLMILPLMDPPVMEPVAMMPVAVEVVAVVTPKMVLPLTVKFCAFWKRMPRKPILSVLTVDPMRLPLIIQFWARVV